ncbi:MAG: D-tyrosyl-tRNA(Tyr) deacylase [Prevotellaceae bacterium]|jgi:D-tyrosyl-tRNA(Tyr) deacylase|nr:D-tyrosyl-tRNA(Tyr) deacylase [Prevotellaceae bacterium]
MKTVIQRVSQASVTIDGVVKSQIGKGMMLLVSFEETDTIDDLIWLAAKVCKLRIFDDEQGVMNISAQDTDSEMLIVSQFTLHASTKKGNRPSYIKAAKPEIAIPLYEKFIEIIEAEFGKKIQTGTFGADMKVALINDGPVTILIDTKNKE